MSDVEEIAKAISATAELLQPLAKVSCRILENITLEPSRELGLFLRDKVRLLRVANAQRVAQLAVGKLERRQMLDAEAPVGFLGTTIEQAADAETPELQELWAELIANGVVTEEYRHPSYGHTLASLDSNDAALFSEVAKRAVAGGRFRRLAFHLPPANLAQRGRLVALGLFEPYFRPVKAPNPRRYASPPALDHLLSELEKSINEQRDSPLLVVSQYGEQFARAVGLAPAKAPHDPGSRRR